MIYVNFINIMYKYSMKIIKYNNTIQLLFFIIWCFFLLRISKAISIESTIADFDKSKLIFAFADIISLIIFLGFISYLIFDVYKRKKISLTSLLIFYPIFALIGYYLSDYKNEFQESIIINQFISLTSVLLYFSFIQTNKIFDYKFKKLLVSAVVIFFVFYTLLIIFPDILNKINSYQELRYSYKSILNIFGNKIYLNQNVNGQTKFLVILLIITFILFKKYYFKNKIISHLFFFIGLLFLILIYLMQTRLNILASFIFLFFFISSFQNLDFKKKLIYLLIIFILPFLCFNIYTDSQTRFSKLDIKPLEYKPIGTGEIGTGEIGTGKTRQEGVNLFIKKNIKLKNETFVLLEAFLDTILPISQSQIKQRMSCEGESLELFIIFSRALDPVRGEAIQEEACKKTFNEFKIDKLINIKNNIKSLSSDFDKSFTEIHDHITTSKNLNDKILINYLEIINSTEEIKYEILRILMVSNFYIKDFKIPFSDENKPENASVYLKRIVASLEHNHHSIRDYIFTNCSIYLSKVDGLISGRMCGWELLLRTTTINSFFFGKGFLADQVYLKPFWKTASNSWVHIFNNAGIFSFIIFSSIVFFFLFKFFKIKNFQNENIYISFSNYIILFLIMRSMLEDTIAFVSFDFLLLGICMIFIKEAEDSKIAK